MDGQVTADVCGSGVATGDNCDSTVRGGETIAIDQSRDGAGVTIDQCAAADAVARDEGEGMRDEARGQSAESPVQGAPAATTDAAAPDPALPHPSSPIPHPFTRAAETEPRRAKGTGGLQLEKTGIYTLRCVVNGKRISKSTGTRDLKEAEAFAKRYLSVYVKDEPERTYLNIQAAVMTERQLAEMKEEEGPQLKLADAWTAYMSSPMRRDLAQSTLDGKEMVWRVFVEWLGKVHPEIVEVRHFRREQAEEYLNYLRQDHAASTYNNRLCVLREVYRNVMQRARAKENPWEGFPLRADDSHSRRELTVEELARLVEMANREGWEYRTLFAIAMYTGLRLGDCCKLTWSEVDIVRSIIQKVPEKTKKYRKGRPITVPIHKVLADLLMQTPVERRTGFVLPTIGPLAANGGHAGMGKIHHVISKIFKNAGIVTSVKVEGRKWTAPEATFHSLRHTFVSMSANAGVPLHIVQSIVGHESTAMTRHYYHENVAALQQAVEAIPSIAETGEITRGAVAPADVRRLMEGRVVTPHVEQIMAVSAGMRDEAGGMRQIEAAPQPSSPIPHPSEPYPPWPVAPESTERVQPATVVSADGVERANPGAEVPLAGRSAERNETRRSNKLLAVEAANAAAAQVGGWGVQAPVYDTQLKTVNKRPRTEWISLCVKKWSDRQRLTVLAGTLQLVKNGGYNFLGKLWDQGEPMLPEQGIEAMEVFLQAKGK